MLVILIKYLKRVKISTFIFIGICLILLISILFGILSASGVSSENPLLDKNIYYIFFSGVIVAPFLETIVFQAIPFYLTVKYLKLKRKFCLFVFISPILFIHDFNLSYIFISYLVGFVFAFMYYIAYFRKENAISVISIIHFINNFIAFLAHLLS